MGLRIQQGDVIAGRYRVEHVLGEGGMGIVVSAWDTREDARVALKVMLPKAFAFSNAKARFFREARLLARLRNRHVARALDVGKLPDGLPFIAMEYLHGIDLSELLGHCVHVQVSEAAAFVVQACCAVQEAHALGIIHRDLKLSNLFLTVDAAGIGVIKVLDFGLAKMVEATPVSAQFATTTVSTMGSPPYMSPEQAKAVKEVDARADVWSLGVILYQLVTGRVPFIAESAAEILAQVLYADPPPMRDGAPWVSEGFERIVLRCLRKDPAERFQTVEALADALLPFAEKDVHTATDIVLPEVSARASSPRTVIYEPEAVGRLVAHLIPTQALGKPGARRGTAVSTDGAEPEPPTIRRDTGPLAYATMRRESPRRRRVARLGIGLLVLAIAGVVGGFALRGFIGSKAAIPARPALPAASTSAAKTHDADGTKATDVPATQPATGDADGRAGDDDGEPEDIAAAGEPGDEADAPGDEADAPGDEADATDDEADAPEDEADATDDQPEGVARKAGGERTSRASRRARRLRARRGAIRKSPRGASGKKRPDAGSDTSPERPTVDNPFPGIQ